MAIHRTGTTTMGFFTTLFGFSEQASNYVETQQRLLDMATFQEDVSVPFYRRERCVFHIPSFGDVSAGIFSMPSVGELEQQVESLLNINKREPGNGVVTFQNIVGEAGELHRRLAANNNNNIIVIQAASQFNFLEFPSPTILPEAGIEGYAHDKTQGPACAVACAAGTAYRNYLVPVEYFQNINEDENKGSRGQTKKLQINALRDMETFLIQELELQQPPWKVKNGYIESSAERLKAVNQALQSDKNNTLEQDLVKKLRIGVQEDTAITVGMKKSASQQQEQQQQRLVTQTYNSAISIGYSVLPDRVWEPIARIVLNATYEATLLVAVIQAMSRETSTTNPMPTTTTVYLTKVGGGVFRNKDSWIYDAIDRAVQKVQSFGVSLDVRLVHFGKVDPFYNQLETGELEKSHQSEL